MEFVDTHSHFYLEQFDADRDEVFSRTMNAGVKTMLLPNIDSHSMTPMLNVCDQYPKNCFPMIGLHPCDVKENYEKILQNIFDRFNTRFVAVGEVGMDLHWDKTFVEEQKLAFQWQVDFAITHDLPLVIHSRKSFAEILAVLNLFSKKTMRGVFHCFPGDENQAKKVIEKGFLLGIGGTITYKNSGIQEVVKHTPLSKIVLETDAPFLPPVPHRGERNQSEYIPIIAAKIAEIKGVSIEQVAFETTANAKQLFFAC